MDKKAILEARDLWKSYEAHGKAVPVLKGISLELMAGESLSIQGPSGVGKTTLVNLLSMLERPEKGQVFWKGEAVHEKKQGWLTQRRAEFIGLVFQHYYLIPELNALENVLVPRRILGKVTPGDVERARELMEQLGVLERAEHMSGQLSGGERQRVAIARAMMNQPEIILADEPTGNLDEASGARVMDALLDICSKNAAGLILVTHNREFAKQTNKKIKL